MRLVYYVFKRKLKGICIIKSIFYCVEERIGDKFLRKLYEKTVNNGIESIDKDEIGKEIGIIDVQMDNLVDELSSEGYIKKIGRTKIYLTVDGRKRAEL